MLLNLTTAELWCHNLDDLVIEWSVVVEVKVQVSGENVIILEITAAECAKKWKKKCNYYHFLFFTEYEGISNNLSI